MFLIFVSVVSLCFLQHSFAVECTPEGGMTKKTMATEVNVSSKINGPCNMRGAISYENAIRICQHMGYTHVEASHPPRGGKCSEVVCSKMVSVPKCEPKEQKTPAVATIKLPTNRADPIIINGGANVDKERVRKPLIEIAY